MYVGKPQTSPLLSLHTQSLKKRDCHAARCCYLHVSSSSDGIL